MRGQRVVLTVAIGALLVPLGRAQQREMVFDVVSIKSHETSPNGGGSIGWQRGGSWIQVNSTVGALIRSAYPTKVELAGAPSWVDSERFDVEARATFDPNPDERRALLRRLLADHLRFAAHYETQERPVYNLVVARADRQLGPHLHSIDIDCATYSAAEPPGSAGVPPGVAPCTFAMSAVTSMTMTSGGRTMEQLADSLASLAGRPVIDKTDLAGYYAFTLDGIGFNDDVSIFTALQEQLGLKLEAARGPVDVLVIDHVERPTPD